MGLQYQAKDTPSSAYNNKTEMAKDVLGAVQKAPEPDFARPMSEIAEGEAPF